MGINPKGVKHCFIKHLPYFYLRASYALQRGSRGGERTTIF